MKPRYMLLLTNEDNRVMLIGSPRGLSLNEKSAKALAKRYEKSYPNLDVMILTVQPLSILNAPMLNHPMGGWRER